MPHKVLLKPVILLLLFLFSVPVSASPNWDEFHRNIEHFEFEKAGVIAEAFPNGGPRELALAEVAIRMGRVDKTYRHTDQLPKMGALPLQLQAKYCWVKMNQEEARTDFPTIRARKKAASRWRREGLRRQGMLHDHTQLIRDKLTEVEEDETGRVLAELARLKGVDNTQVLETQAFQLYYAEQNARAASVWNVLSEKARLEGHIRAAIFFAVRALGCFPKNEALIAEDGTRLLNESISRKDARAVHWVWGLSWSLSSEEKQKWYGVVVDALPRLPYSEAKLHLLQTLSQSRYPKRLEHSQLGLELARERSDRYYQAVFLRELTEFHTDPNKKRIARRQLAEILSTLDRRGISQSFDGSRENKKDVQNKADSLCESLLVALKAGDCYEAEQLLFEGLQLAFELEGVERINTLTNLSYTVARVGRRSGLHTYRGDLSPLIGKALGEKLRRRDGLLAKVLDNRHSLISTTRLDPYTGQELVNWLVLVDRTAEAMDILKETIETAPAEHQRFAQARALGGLMVEGGDMVGFEMLEDALSTANVSDLATAGWLALKHGQTTRALDWSGRALDGAPERAVVALQLIQLQTLALADAGDAIAALKVLENGRSVRPSLPHYEVIKADLLLRLGQPKEADEILRGATISPLGQMTFYEFDVRRAVAKAVGRSNPLKSEVTDYLEAVSDDPIFSLYISEALQRSTAVRPPMHKSTISFAELSSLLESLRQREPTNEELKEISITDFKRLLRSCQSDELIVQAILLKHSIVFFTLRQDRVDYTEVFCNSQKLDKIIDSFIQRLSSPNTNFEGLDLDYLFSRLVEPWLAKHKTADRLRWMARGRLAQLPLAAMPDGQGGYLRDSLSSKLLDGPLVGSFGWATDDRVLLIGGAPDLDGATKELEDMESLFPASARWTLGTDLLELRKKSLKAKIIHISAHASAPSQRRSSGQLRGDGNILTAFQLSELVLSEGSLAFVAACESLKDAETGRDNTSLVSALRAAGADTVIGALWRVDDRVTSALATSFYKHLKQGETAEEALNLAQAEIAKRWPHPYFWAGLQIVTGP